MIKALWLLLLLYASPGSLQQPATEQQTHERLLLRAGQLKLYAARQDCSTKVGILVDMSIISRRKRFFVVNLDNDSILISGLCAHGAGNNVNREDVVFSNSPGSYLTSEGRYKIGAKFEGEFGTGYRLHGLDTTNSNALVRGIVFHWHPAVTDVENARVARRSNGCPMVSESVFRATEKLVDTQDKPVLMWIYK